MGRRCSRASDSTTAWPWPSWAQSISTRARSAQRNPGVHSRSRRGPASRWASCRSRTPSGTQRLALSSMGQPHIVVVFRENDDDAFRVSTPCPGPCGTGRGVESQPSRRWKRPRPCRGWSAMPWCGRDGTCGRSNNHASNARMGQHLGRNTSNEARSRVTGRGHLLRPGEPIRGNTLENNQPGSAWLTATPTRFLIHQLIDKPIPVTTAAFGCDVTPAPGADRSDSPRTGGCRVVLRACHSSVPGSSPLNLKGCPTNQPNPWPDPAQRQVQRQRLAELIGQLLARHWLRIHRDRRTIDEKYDSTDCDVSPPAHP